MIRFKCGDKVLTSQGVGRVKQRISNEYQVKIDRLRFWFKVEELSIAPKERIDRKTVLSVQEKGNKERCSYEYRKRD